MKRFLTALLLLAAPFLMGVNYVGITMTINPITVSCTTSRTTGIAPLMVFYDCTASTATTLTSIPIHELEYTWNFGDTTNPNAAWANGTRTASGSKNVAYGPVAAHVYEGVGTYTAAVTVKYNATTNNASMSAVTTSDPEVSFATTGTICISSSGTFTGCPSGATNTTSSNFDRTMSANKRYLFRCGESFASASGASPATGPGTVGAYNDTGTVTASNTCTKPIVNIGANSGNAFIMHSSNVSDWRFMDLDIRRNGHTNTAAVDGTGSATKTQLTMMRLTFDTTTGLVVDSADATQPTQIAFIENTSTNAESEQIYGYSASVAALGNSVTSTTASGIVNLFRPIGWTGAVMSNNTVAGGPSTGGSAVTIRSHGSAASVRAGKIVVSDNIVDAGSNGTVVGFAVSDINDLQPQNVIIERNVLSTLLGNTAVDAGGFDQVSIRNNLINLAKGAGGNDPVGIQLRGALVGAHDASNNYVYNNTIYNATSGGTQNLMQTGAGGSTVTGAVFKNNLGYSPNGGTVVMLNDVVGGATAANNSTNGQAKSTTPTFTVNPPSTTPANWQPTCTSSTYPCAQGTSVPVWSDFFIAAEPATRDIGAVNH